MVRNAGWPDHGAVHGARRRGQSRTMRGRGDRAAAGRTSGRSPLGRSPSPGTPASIRPEPDPGPSAARAPDRRVRPARHGPLPRRAARIEGAMPKRGNFKTNPISHNPFVSLNNMEERGPARSPSARRGVPRRHPLAGRRDTGGKGAPERVRPRRKGHGSPPRPAAPASAQRLCKTNPISRNILILLCNLSTCARPSRVPRDAGRDRGETCGLGCRRGRRQPVQPNAASGCPAGSLSAAAMSMRLAMLWTGLNSSMCGRIVRTPPASGLNPS